MLFQIFESVLVEEINPAVSWLKSLGYSKVAWAIFHQPSVFLLIATFIRVAPFPRNQHSPPPSLKFLHTSSLASIS